MKSKNLTEFERGFFTATISIKLILIFLAMILLVGSVSAWEWDNVGKYNEETKTMTIINALGLGDNIAEIKLQTPLNFKVNRGYQKVAQFEVKSFTDYNNALKELELFNKRKENKEFFRNYDYKVLSYETILVNDYENILVGNSPNGTAIYEYQKVGEHEEQKEVWTKLTPANFKKNDVLTIGIFTEVKKNDYIEWIPNFFGVRIDEWASWSESFKVGLIAYYSADEGSGTNTLDNVTGNFNATSIGGEVTGGPGKLGKGLEFIRANTEYATINTNLEFPDNATFSFWINRTQSATIDIIMSKRATNVMQIQIESEFYKFFIWTPAQTSCATPSGFFPQDIYTHVVAVYNGTQVLIYKNGELNTSCDITGTIVSADVPTHFGFDDGSVYADIGIDEIAIFNRSLTSEEINESLYNDGDGCAFDDNLCTVNPPSITLNSPINNFNSSSKTIIFNGSVIDPDGIINVTLIIDGLFNETNITGINNTEYIFTKILSEGTHTWNLNSCDGLVDCGNGTERSLTIDTISPTLNITFPTTEIDFHEINKNLSVNWTINDTNLDTCILQFEGVNRTVTCLDNQTEINITNNINKTIIFYANDTFGNVNSSSRTWDYSVFENNQTFNVNVFEGSTETLTANVIVDGSNSLSVATLFYNGTPLIGSFVTSGDGYILSKNLQILEVESETNITFVWNLQLSGGLSINITPHNQTISSLNLDDCSVNTVVLYNYTIVDEGNQSKLSDTSAELNINIKDTSGKTFIANFSKLYTETNPFAVCLNLDFSSSIYSVDSVVRYESNDHVVEYYNILNSTLTNTTIPINITLFDLATSDSTEFKISFKGEDFVFVENALIFIDRQYIAEDNTFKTVELPKTDSEGQTVGHFVRSDAVYNIRVVKNSVLLATFNNIIAFCQDFTIGDCQIVLVATPSSQSTFDYDSELGILFDVAPTYNNDTNSVSFSYSTTDGTPKTVFLEVTRSDIFGNRTICNNTVTSASGTLSCSVDPNIDETNLITKVYVDGKLTILSNIILDSSSIYGNLAYTLWFFLTFVFILGFGTSKTEVLIGLVISIIGAISLGLVRGDIVGIGSAGVWMIVIVLLGIWKLNKENSQ